MLDQIELNVGGAPVTFQTSVPFEIVVPRIITTDFEELRREDARYLEQQAARLAPLLELARRRARVVRLRQLATSTEQATAVLKELEQAVSAISGQVGADETSVALVRSTRVADAGGCQGGRTLSQQAEVHGHGHDNGNGHTVE